MLPTAVVLSFLPPLDAGLLLSEAATRSDIEIVASTSGARALDAALRERAIDAVVLSCSDETFAQVRDHLGTSYPRLVIARLLSGGAARIHARNVDDLRLDEATPARLFDAVRAAVRGRGPARRD